MANNLTEINNATIKKQQAMDLLNADTMHTACVIDDEGNEIPITREMIDASCQLLEQKSQSK